MSPALLGILFEPISRSNLLAPYSVSPKPKISSNSFGFPGLEVPIYGLIRYSGEKDEVSKGKIKEESKKLKMDAKLSLGICPAHQPHHILEKHNS